MVVGYSFSCFFSFVGIIGRLLLNLIEFVIIEDFSNLKGTMQVQYFQNKGLVLLHFYLKKAENESIRSNQLSNLQISKCCIGFMSFY